MSFARDELDAQREALWRMDSGLFFDRLIRPPLSTKPGALGTNLGILLKRVLVLTVAGAVLVLFFGLVAFLPSVVEVELLWFVAGAVLTLLCAVPLLGGDLVREFVRWRSLVLVRRVIEEQIRLLEEDIRSLEKDKASYPEKLNNMRVQVQYLERLQDEMRRLIEMKRFMRRRSRIERSVAYKS